MLSPVLADEQRPVVDVNIIGDAPDMRDSLLAHVKLAELACATPAWRVRAAYRDAADELRHALQAFGYYSATITPSLTEAEACWSARFDIEPGALVLLREPLIEIHGEGSADPSLTGYVNKSPLRAGQPLRHQQYETFKRGLGRLAAARGYLKWRWIERRLLVDPTQGHADIQLIMTTGPLHRIGELQVSETGFDPRLIDGLNSLKQGQPMTSRSLIAADRRLSDSGYFSDVEVQPLLAEAKERNVPVRVGLRTRKRHAYRFGVGIDSDTGPRLSAAYEDRYFNPRGHRLEADLSLSAELSSLHGKYEIPVLSDPSKRIVSLSAAAIREQTDVVDSDRIELATSYRYPRGNWREEPYLKFILEDSRAGTVEQGETEFLTLAGIRWDLSRYDDPINTRHGHKLGFSVHGAHESLLSDATFAQATADAGLIRSFKSKLRLIARAEVGLTIGDTGLELPPSQRFYAGGDRSVRGYDYQRLAPRDDAGDPRGGSYLATASLELDYPVWGDWYGAVFVDAGNAADSLGELVDVETAVGIGVRWLTPVGPVRVDLAFPQDTSEDDFRIHFGLGAEL